MIKNITYDDNGLIPVIIQDDITGKVLMLAYMNEEALQKTIETNETWFYSRSRKELWNKGATSGNRQKVKSIALDCDQDALLVTVDPLGPACHTGEESCFFNIVNEKDFSKREVIHTIVDVIEARRNNPVEGSYTTYLFNEGIDKVLKKVGEEASEVIIGAKNNDKEEIKWEIADLVYHTLVLMNITGVSLSDIKDVLYERHVQKKEDKND
ncbi:bifunctional phosphoribosyl-AMP cyclohydrolase/phosphoribosyl-ATP diphosphatase HisIE [Pseudogracilibacillus sp. SO30301A]|uniref:bifunctional phosphoribosyl-AMP cyclohydrolase/phosphoribosyl-ATP diphosphatase HisIE n=1 Tax=Pseudogracilibacillus sp. SO30301A TaxID=3098291 RepID=UPI00300E10A0